ncbi:uncharacterized protein V6R79_008852 [Siganus canaliculatus]
MPALCSCTNHSRERPGKKKKCLHAQQKSLKGLSYHQRKYGQVFKILMPSHIETIRFTPVNKSPPTIVWRRRDPPAGEDGKHILKGIYFVIQRLTQEDSGKYELLEKNSEAFSTRELLVEENTKHFTRETGESLDVTFNLERSSCNIIFIPENTYVSKRFQLVHRGALVDQNSHCWFDVVEPCGFVSENLKMECAGRFEFQDSNDNLAMVAFLEINDSESDVFSVVGGGLGIFFIVSSCCCCMKYCCCGESSGNKDESPEAEAEPALPVEQSSVPVRPASPPSVTPYPTPPSYTPSAPLIHYPPPEAPPPAYSEISVPLKPADAPTGAVSSDSEPRFDLKGMNFGSMLGSSSSDGGVYTSDKLNFL